MAIAVEDCSERQYREGTPQSRLDVNFSSLIDSSKSVDLVQHGVSLGVREDFPGANECERSCDASCDPGTLERRCPSSGLAGACSASCESRVCLAGEGTPVACAVPPDTAVDGSIDPGWLARMARTGESLVSPMLG